MLIPKLAFVPDKYCTIKTILFIIKSNIFNFDTQISFCSRKILYKFNIFEFWLPNHLFENAINVTLVGWRKGWRLKVK